MTADRDWFADGSTAKAVDVAALMDSGAPETVWRLVQAGALVSLGATSDGGALGVTVTLDGRWRREYFRDSDELVSWLLGAAEAVEDEVASQAASSGRRMRSRRARGA